MLKHEIDDPLLGTTEVARELNMHPGSIYRELRQNPAFPKPFYKSVGRLAWRQSQIVDYIKSRPVRHVGRKAAVRA